VSAACRGCGGVLPPPFLDLGAHPLANAYRDPADASPEATYPLAVTRCPACQLAQLTHVVSPDLLFSDYPYFSSVSMTTVRHAEVMADALAGRFALGPASRVVEVASNDGYLLQFFQRRGIPVLGIEPAKNIAEAARARGIPTLDVFFGTRAAPGIRAEHGAADVLIGNNVLAHAPELLDFLSATEQLLAPDGVAVFEFPYLGRTIDALEFDTVYHEHVFYFSVHAIRNVAARAGLELFDVETYPVQGLSLRIFLGRPGRHPQAPAVAERLAAEVAAGLTGPERYQRFAADVFALRERFRAFLEELRARGRVAAYGAPAKGNTFLNFCGVDARSIEFTVDRSPHKQGRLLPGSRIPILAPEELARRRPDFALILPWNLVDEIAAGTTDYTRAGGRFVVALPEPHELAT
jgi:SAM-dependent methyltransferase